MALQYFAALREGQRRVAKARDYLNAVANDRAMPALALRDTKTSSWEPVGDETYYAFVTDAPGFVLTDTSGYLLALVDKAGTSKAIVQNVTAEQKKEITKKLDTDGIGKFEGDIILPV